MNFLIQNSTIRFYSEKVSLQKNSVFFVSNQKAHPSGLMRNPG